MHTTINMLQAKSSLSRLVKSIELGQEHKIVIAKELFDVPDTIDANNAEVAKLFIGESLS